MYQETRDEQKDGEEEEGKFWDVECNIIAQIRITNKALAAVEGLRPLQMFVSTVARETKLVL